MKLPLHKISCLILSLLLVQVFGPRAAQALTVTRPAGIEFRGGVVFCDTNGNDATFVLGDPTKPCATPGFAFTNCPQDGAIIFTPGQLFRQNAWEVTWTNDITVIADGCTFAGVDTNGWLRFRLGQGGVDWTGGTIDSAYNWVPGLVTGAVLKFTELASSNRYWFHGVTLSGMSDCLHSASTDEFLDASDLWFDRCNFRTAFDAIKFHVQSSNTTVRLTGCKMYNVYYPGYDISAGSPFALTGGRLIVEDTTYHCSDTKPGGDQVFFYNQSNAVPARAEFHNCRMLYSGTNTVNVVDLRGNATVTFRGGNITPSTGRVLKSGATDSVTWLTFVDPPQLLFNDNASFPFMTVDTNTVFVINPTVALDAGKYKWNATLNAYTNIANTRLLTNDASTRIWILRTPAVIRHTNFFADLLAPSNTNHWSNAIAGAGTLQMSFGYLINTNIVSQ